MGLLVRRQAGQGRHPRSVRSPDGKGRTRARRRQHGAAHEQHRLLEHADGPGPLYGPAVERFHLGVTALLTLSPAPSRKREGEKALTPALSRKREREEK